MLNRFTTVTRYPAAAIGCAVLWYFRFQVSLRDIEETDRLPEPRMPFTMEGRHKTQI